MHFKLDSTKENIINRNFCKISLIHIKCAIIKVYFNLLNIWFHFKKILFFKEDKFMRTLEMKIAIPEVKGGRCVSAEMKDGYILAKFEIQ